MTIRETVRRTAPSGRPEAGPHEPDEPTPTAADTQSVESVCSAHVLSPEKRAATYDDLCALPDNVVGEILAGELHVQPRPAPRHAVAQSGLGAIINGAYGHGTGVPGGWRILFEPELRLGADTLVPDIAGWRRERMPALPRDGLVRARARTGSAR